MENNAKHVEESKNYERGGILIQFTGGQYLMIDIASQYGHGLDKSQFEDRLAWTKEHEDELESLVDDAKKPFQYIAAVLAYRDAQNGIPTGHIVELDAAASGPQIMAALTGCKDTARNTGLIGDKCNDIYSITLTEVGKILGESMEGISRTEIKYAQMTYYYGSNQKPKALFGEDTPAYKAFHKANFIVAPGACEMRELLLSLWPAYELSYEFTMPDGFHAYIPIMQQTEAEIEVDELDHASFTYTYSVNEGSETGKSTAANTIHACDSLVCRELGRRCNYDGMGLAYIAMVISDHLANGTYAEPKEIPRIERLAVESGFYSLVGVESIGKISVTNFSKEYLTRILGLIDDTLKHKSFPVVFIHDAFRAHPNNCNRVRQVYKDIMAEIAESNMLEFILNQISSTPIKIQKYSDDLGDEIRNGSYAIS